MKTKFIWLALSCLMVVALVLASCRAPVTEKKEVKGVVKEPEKKVEEVEAVEPETKYGGILIHAVPWEVTTFDPLDAVWQAEAVMGYTHNSLIEGDWWIDRDICDFKFFYDYRNREDAWAGMLVESWEQPNPLTIVFNIRKGVRWQNLPPLNGREFVAEDVKAHFERLLAGPRFEVHQLQNIESITTPDKYTVEMALKAATYTSLRGIGTQQKITAHELWEQYGDLRDWRTTIGTGPFILEDFVMGSSMTFKSNPDYWEKDLEGNSLPYIDGTKMLIITDSSTMIAALQTGKIDTAIEEGSIPWRQKAAIATATPELLWERHRDSSFFDVYMKTTEAPFNSLQVRQALTMAINFQELADTVHEPGAALALSYPAHPTWEGIYVPYDELPESVKKVRTYNPTEAKKMMVAAGYPTGFDVTIHYNAVGPWAFGVDALQLISKYWEDIGVTLDMVPVDWGTIASFGYTPFPYHGMMGRAHGHLDPAYQVEFQFASGGAHNRSVYSDPTGYVDETFFKKILVETDFNKRNQLYKDVFLYLTEQCVTIPVPAGVSYVAWWPWVKGYSGEATINYHQGGILKYLWLDQELRKEMTGR